MSLKPFKGKMLTVYMLSIRYIINNVHVRVHENVLKLHFTCEYMIINETTLSNLPRRMSGSFRTQTFQSI